MESDDDLEAYNPDQSLEERREIQRGIRTLEKDMHENAEQYMQSGSKKVSETLKKLEIYATNIRQTNEAAIDSKALLTLSDLQHRKLQRLTAGSIGNGVDADEFVSKCITYMRRGAGIAADKDDELTHTQRNRRPVRRDAIGSDNDDEDENGAGGDMLDWAHLGRYACIPNVRRPALPGFLLGPLSVEKKVRRVVTRRAPLRLRDLEEVRPEVLNTEDLAKNENDLTAICNKILKQLKRVRNSAIEELQRINDDDNMDDNDMAEAMERLGIVESGNIDLVRFCINPRSFGQTVENMFYVSFLIREGMVEIHYEENGLPSLCPSSAGESEQASTTVSKNGTMKRQAILSIDMPTWKDLITTFNIKESMIEHRKEAKVAGPGARGWYS
ncbi:hypothetical protein VP1G_01529 [Cytospora mali]|uniref:Non-structural maintenance of chromosomes element 4 n=1 Tax=Cytospora mali TaxID=578113 RepID=A0A194UR70_CYTMA|nr:hypothetical protein VP1G_01529 [Valsa mali var. pyri (nom. inval.)]